MKKLFTILSILALFAYVIPVTAQDKTVPISETERIVDKYLSKAGMVIDSTFSKVAPMAEKAFNAYSKGYEARGTIGFYSVLLLLIITFLITACCLYGESLNKSKYDLSLWGGIAIGSGIVFIIVLIIFAVGIGNWYTMMKAPDYWVIQDLLKAVH